MTRSAHPNNKPSPADTPSRQSEDKGGKARVRKADKQYHRDQPHGGDIAKRHEKEEQPLDPGADKRKS